ncbi:MAG: M20/M25/M40 family metallo-hydrolase, partial [Christensenellales bacterium]
MQLNDVVLSYKEEMVSQLCKLISMPSLEAPPLPGQPFGRAMHDCLLYTLDLAKSLGFARMRDVDGYAGYIEMGQGEEEIGILVHLDVVPPGDGWTLPPFEGTVQNGRVYGRGSQDNKGGVIAALYAMRALLSEENTFHKRVRLI